MKLLACSLIRLARLLNQLTASIFFKRILLGRSIYCVDLPHLSRKNSVSLHGHRSNIFIGKSCWFGANVAFVGDNVLIASRVSFVGGDHAIDTCGLPIWQAGRGEYHNSVFIKDDVWIGHGAIIMNGVTLSQGTVIGAGSVLTKDTDPYGIYAGNPARLIRFRS